jgi:hypothetical protein
VKPTLVAIARDAMTSTATTTPPRRDRSQERGAAIFIVVMVMTLLTAVGVLAIRRASMTDAAVGYARQADQAHYLADYVVRLGSYELGEGRGQFYVNQIRPAVAGAKTNQEICPSTKFAHATFAVATVVPCYNIFGNELGRNLNFGSTPAALKQTFIAEPTTIVAGSLGPADPTGLDYGLEQSFLLEILEGFKTTAPAGFTVSGRGANQLNNVQLSVTGWAQLRSVRTAGTADPWCASADTATAASIQAVRALITVPNLPN